MRLFLTTIVLSLVAFSTNAQVQPAVSNEIEEWDTLFKGMEWKAPDFCNGRECPPYVVKKKTDDYELRCYPSYKWISTTVEGPKKQLLKPFMRLYHYIKGENEGHKIINRTVPLVHQIEMGDGKDTTSRYAISLYLPSEYQQSPPEPTNSLVSVTTSPPSCVYVRTYGGYSTKETIKKNIKKLKTSLGKDKINNYVDPKDVFFIGTYDDHHAKFWDRHNEIWLLQYPEDTSDME